MAERSLLWLVLICVSALIVGAEDIYTDFWARSWKLARNCDVYDEKYDASYQGAFAVYCRVDSTSQSQSILQLVREDRRSKLSYFEFYIRRHDGDGKLNITLSFASHTSVTVPVAEPYMKSSISGEWTLFGLELNEYCKAEDDLVSISFYSFDGAQSLVFDNIRSNSPSSSVNSRLKSNINTHAVGVSKESDIKYSEKELLGFKVMIGVGLGIGALAFIVLIALTIFGRVKKALPKSPSYKEEDSSDNEQETTTPTPTYTPSPLISSRSLPDLPSAAANGVSPSASPSLRHKAMPPPPPSSSSSSSPSSSNQNSPQHWSPSHPSNSPSIPKLSPRPPTASPRPPPPTTSPRPSISPRPPASPRPQHPPGLPPKPQLSAERLAALNLNSNGSSLNLDQHSSPSSSASNSPNSSSTNLKVSAELHAGSNLNVSMNPVPLKLSAGSSSSPNLLRSPSSGSGSSPNLLRSPSGSGSQNSNLKLSANGVVHAVKYPLLNGLEKEEVKEEVKQEEEEDDEEDLDEYDTVRRNATTKEEKEKKEKHGLGLSLTSLFIPPPVPPKPAPTSASLIEPEEGMELVHPIVKDTCHFLSIKGLKEEGILRLAGSSSEVTRLQNSYLNNEPPNFESCFDINSIGDLLKRHLRGMPEPFITMYTLPPFQEGIRATDVLDKVALIKGALLNPALSREKVMTMKVLFLFLHQVMQYSSINKMSSSNLAVVFSPTLRMPPDLVDLFVKYADQIFAL